MNTTLFELVNISYVPFPLGFCEVSLHTALLYTLFLPLFSWRICYRLTIKARITVACERYNFIASSFQFCNQAAFDCLLASQPNVLQRFPRMFTRNISYTNCAICCIYPSLIVVRSISVMICHWQWVTKMLKLGFAEFPAVHHASCVKSTYIKVF
jgi:hypothetical protein